MAAGTPQQMPGRRWARLSTTRDGGGRYDWFHIGSDASGIVYAAGPEVTNVKGGDEVVQRHRGSWGIPEAVDVKAADDRCFAPSFKIWGPRDDRGSFACSRRCGAHQLMPKAKHLTWKLPPHRRSSDRRRTACWTNWRRTVVRPNDVAGKAGGPAPWRSSRPFGGDPDRRRLQRGEGRKYCKKLGAQYGHPEPRDFRTGAACLIDDDGAQRVDHGVRAFESFIEVL